MTKYEYDFETIELNAEQQAKMEMGMGDINILNPIIRDVLNKRAKKGWEPLYPFSVPQLWFRKVKTIRKKITKKP